MLKSKILISAIAMSVSGICMEGPVNLPFEFVSMGTAAENSDNPRINIYDRIGESLWEEGVTAKAFTNQLSAIDNKADIDLYISTNGGDTKDGTVMYNALVNRAGKTNVIIDGYAISMGSVLAMAGKNSGGSTKMASNALMMIHKPVTGVYGNADEMRSQADVLDKVEDALCAPYCQATGLDKSAISAMLAETRWMTAEEAKEDGFIDEVIDSTNEVEACLSKSFLDDHKAKYGTIPEAFINQFVKTEESDPAPNNPENVGVKDEPAPESVDDVSDVDLVALERKRCSDIQQMCVSNGFPEKAQSFIAKGTKLEDAQEFIVDLKASLDERIDSRIVDENQPTVQGGDWDSAYSKIPGVSLKK